MTTHFGRRVATPCTHPSLSILSLANDGSTNGMPLPANHPTPHAFSGDGEVRVPLACNRRPTEASLRCTHTPTTTRHVDAHASIVEASRSPINADPSTNTHLLGKTAKSHAVWPGGWRGVACSFCRGESLGSCLIHTWTTSAAYLPVGSLTHVDRENDIYVNVVALPR